MTVTVVMSTYNGEKYLREQIESILRQEEADVRLFVRDDGSDDGTPDILREYAAEHDNITYVSGQNLGAAGSFREALRLAPDTPYYAFADQDDVWLPDKIRAGVRALESSGCAGEETAALYTCRTVSVDEGLRPLAVRELYTRVSLGSSLLENRVSGCTFVFNRKARELYLLLPEEHICMHDWDLLRIVLAVGGRLVQDENGYVLYRQHASNVVGAGVSRRRRAEKLFGGQLLRDLRSRLAFADEIRRLYADSIPEENRRILDLLCDYKESVPARLALVRSKEIARKNRADNLVFKALFLMGLL